MRRNSLPRLSQAKELLPVIRAQLVAAAANHSIPAGLDLDLLPIVEDGLVGYELLPNQATCSYLTIGCDARGVPLLRETLYRTAPAGALRVASVDGRTVSQNGSEATRPVRQRDAILPDWSSAAHAAWTELAALFPQQPRHGIAVHDGWHACLDEALSIAYAYLAACDPCIEFCGVPDEARYGFALTHDHGGRGLLTSREPGKWALWFQSPNANLSEEWATARPHIGAAAVWGCAGSMPRDTTWPDALPVPTMSGAASRRVRGRRATDGPWGDRLDADRRHADRRYAKSSHAVRPQDDRRQKDRRQRG